MDAKTPKKLKRVVIKEEFVVLTGNFVEALLLNQFLYWSERIQDIDAFLGEENERRSSHGMESVGLQKGWIYKKAKALKSELMIDIHLDTFKKHVESLISKGYLHRRQNPKFKWDKTYQYRVDFVRVVKDLRRFGYVLEGFTRLVLPQTINFEYEVSDQIAEETRQDRYDQAEQAYWARIAGLAEHNQSILSDQPAEANSVSPG